MSTRFRNPLVVGGTLTPTADNSYDLGSDSLRFKDLCLAGQIRLHATDAYILHTTTDNSDTHGTYLCGAADAHGSRGGWVSVFGNEHASNPGKAIIATGNASGNAIEFHTNNQGVKWSITSAGVLNQNGTNGGLLTFNRANTTINFAGSMGSSTKNPESDPETGWIEVQVGGVARYIPYYAAS